ncbi:lipase secretion chaperone [Vibrio profundi]|uniref:lipase secretion chaperone n=1 Tax=Vibrio profundi TaxID=1774960 RepID=UPI003735F9B6
MKKTTLMIMIASVSAGAVFYFSHQSKEAVEASESVLQVSAQKDTAIDQSSPKDTMEYFISGLVEVELPQMGTNLAEFKKQQPDSMVDEELFEKYLMYKSALQQLDLEYRSSLNLESLTRLHHALLDLQMQFFTSQEQELLFAHDNRMRELALQKLQLQTDAFDNEDYYQQWQSTLDLQPEYIQQSQKNQSLLVQLANTNALDSQQKYIDRTQLVGEEAAQRLEALDEERVQFEADLSDYLSQRGEVLNDATLSKEQQSTQIAALRNHAFPADQLKRVQALERIHDSSHRQD